VVVDLRLGSRVTVLGYDIEVEGRLGPDAAVWFDQLEILPGEDGRTHLRGWFVDQAALHGVLTQLGDLGVAVTALRRLPRGG
jgi:hypothetical protein